MSLAKQIDIHDPAVTRPCFSPEPDDLLCNVSQSAGPGNLVRSSEVGAPEDFRVRVIDVRKGGFAVEHHGCALGLGALFEETSGRGDFKRFSNNVDRYAVA